MTRKQSLSTLKMQELQPQIKKMQEKYKDSPQKQQEAMAKIYKESGYNPMSGCLPMGVQFLILFAMYNLFNNYFYLLFVIGKRSHTVLFFSQLASNFQCTLWHAVHFFADCR